MTDHFSDLFQSYYLREKVDPLKVKEDMVEYAKLKWPLLFSRFYEALKVTGPSLSKNDVIIAINWTGIYFVDDQEQVLLELPFAEITSIQSHKSGRPFIQNFTLSTLRGDDFMFQSPNAEDICDLVNFFLSGLKERSKYLAALQDHHPEPGSGISLNQGDLLILDQGVTGEQVMRSGWVPVVNERTGEAGDVPSEMVYVIPMSTKPPASLLALFSRDLRALEERDRSDGSVNGVDLKEKPHTLQEYALDLFRVPGKQRTLTFSSNKKKGIEQLWRHSREPIKQPLLKKLLNKEELSQHACEAFNAILKYMGDLPSRRTRSGNDLTDVIFEYPLKYDILRDEIYCQIMKQLTENRNR